MSKKRQREPRTVDVELIEIYEDLANESENIRLKAAQSLLLKLSPEKEFNRESVENVLNRLFRGLASGRKAARIGFSVALTEVLSELFVGDRKLGQTLGIDLERVIELLKTRTDVGGNVSGQEERDHYLGRLFGAEALIKSSALFPPTASIDQWTLTVDLILGLSQKKSWLREECGWILHGAVHLLAVKQIDESYAERLVERLCENNMAKTSEGVAIWISVQTLFPTAKMVKGVWRDDDPLHSKEKSTLAKVLRETVTQEDKDNNQQKLQKGMWTSRVPFAWNIVISKLLAPAESRDKYGKKQLSFAGFWSEVVDDGLFAASSSEERKFWGFHIFSTVLQTASEDLIPIIFSKNFMRSLINQLASSGRYLHGAAQKAMKAVHARIEAVPDLAFPIIRQLLSEGGCINFDQVTKTKTTERILSLASNAALTRILPFFRALALRPNPTEPKAAEGRRQLLADQLLSTIRAKKSGKLEAAVAENEDWIKEVLEFFVELGYFVPVDSFSKPQDLPQPPLSVPSQNMFRSRISSVLGHLISSRPGLPYFVVQVIQSQKALADRKALFDADEDVEDSLQRAWKTLEKIHSKASSSRESKKAHLGALELLYSLTILQVYNGETDAVSLLDELRICYENLVKRKSNDEDIDGSLVLVEVLLSFVSKPSLLFRKLAHQVFSSFAPEISGEGLESMIKILETKESLSGQQEMFDDNADDGEDENGSTASSEDGSDDDDVEEIDGSDVSMVDADGDDGEGSEEDDDEEEEEEEENDDDEADADELAEFDAKLAEALGTKPFNPDDQGGESSDEDMDDEQMMALEPHLAKVFQERRKASQHNKKQEKKDAKENIINFKNRVLELMEIFVKQQHTNPLALNLIVPLLTLIRTTTSKVVSDKACGVVREYSKACKGKDVPVPSDVSATWKLLQDVHAEAMKEASHAHNTACSQLSILLVKVLVAADRESLKRALLIYAETQTRWVLEQKCRVQPSFFTDWQNWCTSAKKQLQK